MCACEQGVTCPRCRDDDERYDGKPYDREREGPWEVEPEPKDEQDAA